MTDSALNRLGVDLDRVDTSSQYDQGTQEATRNGKAVYVKAASGISQFDAVVWGPASAAASASIDAFPASATNVLGRAVGFAQTSIASGSFGWVHTEVTKEGQVNVAVGCQPNVPLFLTGTAGVLDDATVSANRVDGVYALASAASASSVPFVAINPIHHRQIS